jgi:preprotein translocase subunit SecA
LIKSAFQVKEMIPNDTYIISRDKSKKTEVNITVIDKDTGTEQLSTRWSNGVHQFLQLKHSRRFTPESLKAVFISNMSFFKRYKNNIIGLTGSLGSIDEQNLLNSVYQLRFFKLPRFKSESFRELKGSVHTTEEN